MANITFPSRLALVSALIVGVSLAASDSRAHDEVESCDAACKAAKYEKYKKWKAEQAAKSEAPAENESQADGESAEDQEDHHHGEWTEEQRAAWREKWKNFDWEAYRARHGDAGHVCRRGISTAKKQVEQIDRSTDNQVKEQLDAVKEARETLDDNSGIARRAANALLPNVVKMQRNIDRIEEKIVKGKPVSKKEIEKIEDPQVRRKLMKAVDAQGKIQTLERERKSTLEAIDALEKMAIATEKSAVDLSTLQKNAKVEERAPESPKAAWVRVDKDESEVSAASTAQGGEKSPEVAAGGQPAMSPKEKLREALKNRMLAREQVGKRADEVGTESLFAGELNMARPKDDYVAFTGEVPVKIANPDHLSLGVFQPIKTGKGFAGPETEAEIKRLTMEIQDPSPAQAVDRVPAQVSTATKEPMYLDNAILPSQSEGLFRRIKRFHDNCARKKCVVSTK